MELYFSPFTCSLASHIAAREAGIALTLRQVALTTKQTTDGEDYRAIAPKGYVPALKLDDGTVINENPVVLQYLADQRPESGLLPAPGTRERYEVLEWVGYVSTELHKGILAVIFSAAAPEEAKTYARALAAQKLPLVAAHLEARELLVGTRFTIADAYLTWALTLVPFAGLSFDAWPSLQAYLARMRKRPSVRAALAYDQARYAA